MKCLYGSPWWKKRFIIAKPHMAQKCKTPFGLQLGSPFFPITTTTFQRRSVMTSFIAASTSNKKVVHLGRSLGTHTCRTARVDRPKLQDIPSSLQIGSRQLSCPSALDSWVSPLPRAVPVHSRVEEFQSFGKISTMSVPLAFIVEISIISR